tara:strand:+ start:1513 stop:2613 length:1101 start_codon:yes stop_codon:yes gene_type:complete
LGYFKKIELNCYRNFHHYENRFNKNCNILFGDNGTGKTNILEAISLFDKGTGIRNDRLLNIIKLQSKNFSNFGEFVSLNQNYEIKVFTQNNTNNKLFKKISINNDNKKESLNHFRSLLSFIYFQPEMERLFLLSPSYRRKFIDRFIYCKNKHYSLLLNQYKKYLVERSNLIHNTNVDENWITNIEENIAKLGIEIYNNRKEQLIILNTNLNQLYINKKSPFSIILKISDQCINDYPEIESDLEAYKKLLKSNRKIDKISGRTTCGPHRSDIAGHIEEYLSLDQLSTGEQKTIVLLLIFAQCNYLVNHCNISPIILMDEICSHLDEINRSILLNLLQEFDLQFFMTGTDKNLFSFLSTNAQYYNISK